MTARSHLRLALLALALGVAPLAAAAQNAPVATPAPIAAPAADCTPRQAALGPLGRAAVVAFEGPLSHGIVCAVVANLATNRVRAAFGTAETDAVVIAPVAGGTGGTLVLGGDGSLSVVGGDGGASGRAVGPFVVAPGGVFNGSGDIDAQPRVVLAFAGARTFVIATGAIDLADLARALRDRSSAFGADDAFERAVVLASGPGAVVQIKALDGTLGIAPPAGTAVLSIGAR